MNEDEVRSSGDNSSSSAGSLLPTKPTSTARVRANRANAKRSTGPRTPQGKIRSAENAVKHGIYATKAAAVLAGPYPEDPDEIAAQMQAVIDALAPRDVLEEGIASEFALISLKERRLATFEDGQLVADGDIYDYERSDAADTARTAVHHAIRVWDQSRISKDRSKAMQESDPPWQGMAKCLQGVTIPRIWVPELWTPTITPGTSASWRNVFVALVNIKFPAPHDLGVWLSQEQADHQDRRAERSLHAHRTIALNSIEVVERGTALRGRLVQEKLKLLAMYAVFQERDLG